MGDPWTWLILKPSRRGEARGLESRSTALVSDIYGVLLLLRFLYDVAVRSLTSLRLLPVHGMIQVQVGASGFYQVNLLVVIP